MLFSCGFPSYEPLEAVDHVFLRVVLVPPEWMAFNEFGGWITAVETKESDSLKYFEAAIWEEKNAVYLYEFPNELITFP